MKTLKEVVSTNKNFLMAYLTLGDPTPDLTLKITNALIEGGADILELGLPTKNPKYDGPSIRASYRRALEVGVDIEGAIRLVKKISVVPKIILSYYDTIKQSSLKEFAKFSAFFGANAILLPDLLVDYLESIQDYVDMVSF